MEYKLVEHLTGVSTFAVNEQQELAIIKDNSFFFKYGEDYIKYHDFPNGTQELKFNYYFYWNCYFGNGYFFRNKKVSALNGSVLRFFSQSQLQITRVIDDKTQYYICDLITKGEKMMRNPTSSYSFFFKEVFFAAEWPARLILKKVSIIEDKVIWQTDLKTLGKYFKKEYEIIRVIGVHNGELLVGCSNNVLLAVNHETGEIIYQWQELEHTGDYRFPKSKIGSYHSALLLPNENKLVGGGNRGLWEINLITRAVVVNDLAEEFTKNNINSLTGDKIHSADDTHLILTAYTNEDPDYFKAFLVIFALNKKTYKIDWIHNFGTAMTGTERKTEVAGNKLYQLDTDGNLFIFENV